MCLAVPGRVIEITEDSGLKMGKVDFAGTVRQTCLAYLPDIEVGQYVIVHAGFALNVIDEIEAQKTLDLLDQITQMSGGQPK